MRILSCEQLCTKKTVDNLFPIEPEELHIIREDQKKELLEYINKPLSPYLALAKECHDKFGKRWFVEFLRKRREALIEEKDRHFQEEQRCLIEAHKRGDKTTIEFIKHIRRFPFEWNVSRDRHIAHYDRLIRSLSGKKKIGLSESDIVAARNVPMDDIIDLSMNRSRFVRCPFHDEKTPSCKIYKNNFHCFGCNEHGSPIDWVMKTQDKSFKDAVLFILKR